MADREDRNYDDGEGSLDPEMLYTKEYCIGWDSRLRACGGIRTDRSNRRRQLRQGLQRVLLFFTFGARPADM
jgi:hypothetical protein